VYGGKLSGYLVQADEIVQVGARQTYREIARARVLGCIID